MPNAHQLPDLIHALRLHAGAILEDTPVIDQVERECYALAQLLERVFGLQGQDDDNDPDPYAPELDDFCRELLKRYCPAVAQEPEMKPYLTALYSMVWALGCSNGMQEVYDETHKLCKVIVEMCTEMLEQGGGALLVQRPPRQDKPILTVISSTGKPA